jgi:transcriptional regulator NrdR family protein
MTSKEIESIKKAPHYIWVEHEKIHSVVEKIKSDLRRYGILDDTNEEIFGNFIVSELKKISRKYPLVDEL